MSFLLIQQIAASSRDGVASKKPSLRGIDRFLSKASRFSAGTHGGMSASPPRLAMFRRIRMDRRRPVADARAGFCTSQPVQILGAPLQR
jgi:hypothetical protein